MKPLKKKFLTHFLITFTSYYIIFLMGKFVLNLQYTFQNIFFAALGFTLIFQITFFLSEIEHIKNKKYEFFLKILIYLIIGNLFPLSLLIIDFFIKEQLLMKSISIFIINFPIIIINLITERIFKKKIN